MWEWWKQWRLQRWHSIAEVGPPANEALCWVAVLEPGILNIQQPSRQWVDIATYDDGHWNSYSDYGLEDHTITHWWPLVEPAPPDVPLPAMQWQEPDEALVERFMSEYARAVVLLQEYRARGLEAWAIHSLERRLLQGDEAIATQDPYEMRSFCEHMRETK